MTRPPSGPDSPTAPTVDDVLSVVPDPALALDADGRVRHANAAAARLTDRTPAALAGLALADALPAVLADAVADRLRDPADPRGSDPVLHPPLDRWFAVHVTRQLPPDGAPAPAVVVLRDVTAQERSAFQATLLDFIGLPVYATDLDDRLIYWNRAAEQLGGRRAADVLGRPIDALGLIDPASADPRDDHSAAGTPDRWEGELVALGADGRRFPVVVTRSVLRDADGYRTGTIGTLYDLSERHAYERDLRAARDYLQTVTASIADGLVVFDARGTVTYANPAAGRMLGAQGDLDGAPVTSALYGGDARSAELARLGTERAAEDVFRRRDGSELHVAWSAASLGGHDDSDGRVVVFRDVTEHRAREARLRREAEALGWARRLRRALDEDRFVLHAQPIVATDSGAVVDHELLLRLPDDDGGVIPPGAFLPAAEELGTIVEIDRWVARRAVRCAASGMRVHFNLSGRTIGDETLLQVLRTELASTGADARDLTIEITETALLHDDGGAAAFVAHLRRIGCRVALDDFGTGYNGLGRVREIPADSIKIDRRFVSDLLREPASENVVKAILAFAGEMGLDLVAEGVEDEATAERLRELGVPHAQGFHFGRPEPLAPAAPVG